MDITEQNIPPLRLDARVEALSWDGRSPKLKEVLSSNEAEVVLHSGSTISVRRLKNLCDRALTVANACDPYDELITEYLFLPEEWAETSRRIHILTGEALAFLSMLRLVPLSPINLEKSGTRRYEVIPGHRAWPTSD